MSYFEVQICLISRVINFTMQRTFFYIYVCELVLNQATPTNMKLVFFFFFMNKDIIVKQKFCLSLILLNKENQIIKELNTQLKILHSIRPSPTSFLPCFYRDFKLTFFSGLRVWFGNRPPWEEVHPSTWSLAPIRASPLLLWCRASFVEDRRACSQPWWSPPQDWWAAQLTTFTITFDGSLDIICQWEKNVILMNYFRLLWIYLFHGLGQFEHCKFTWITERKRD